MGQQEMDKQENRLRAHPSERFAGESHFVDLPGALSQLRAEKHTAPGGHRQATLFHSKPVTKILFDFAAGAELADHAASGLVVIQVLEGELIVQAAAERHELHAGMLAILRPNVRHSVRATVASAMLLTVTLEEKS